MRSTEPNTSDIDFNWQDDSDWGMYEFSNVPADVLAKIQDAVWELAGPYLNRTNHNLTLEELAHIARTS